MGRCCYLGHPPPPPQNNSLKTHYANPHAQKYIPERLYLVTAVLNAETSRFLRAHHVMGKVKSSAPHGSSLPFKGHRAPQPTMIRGQLGQCCFLLARCGKQLTESENGNGNQTRESQESPSEHSEGFNINSFPSISLQYLSTDLCSSSLPEPTDTVCVDIRYAGYSIQSNLLSFVAFFSPSTIGN